MKKILLLCLAFSLTQITIHAQDIHEACRTGDLELVKSMISEDPGLVSLESSGGSTPLHFACISDNPQLTEYLISQGASVWAQNKQAYTPLHYAAAYNKPEMMALLIRSGAPLESRSNEGETPLHMASSSGAVAATRLLLEAGADVDAREARERTAFLLAARESGSVDAASSLLLFEADINAVDKNGDGALELAAWRGYADLVDFLLENEIEIPGTEEAQLSLLRHSLKRKLTPLLMALIETGMNLDKYSKDHPELINQAASGGSVDILNILTLHGFSLQYSDRNGWTPMHCAAEFNRVEVLLYLVKKGAAVDFRSFSGQTAYNVAVEEGNKASMVFLESIGCVQDPPEFPELSGFYLGHKEPGGRPEPFAPGIVYSHYKLHSSVAFSPDGQTAAWNIMIPPRESGYGSGRMIMTQIRNGRWEYPQQPLFKGGDVPFFSPDGNRLYFISREPAYEGGPRKENLWYVEKTAAGWSDPRPLNRVVNDAPMHWQFSVDKDNTIYFGSGDGRILVAVLKDGKYQVPVDFRELHDNEEVEGGSPFISPEGDYLIFSKEDALFITFRSPQGSWSAVQKFDDTINAPGHANCPIISPDGEFLFFLQEWTPKWVAIKDKLNYMRDQALSIN